MEPIIYAEALDLIEAHRAAGHGLPGVGVPRGDRRSRWPSTWASTAASPPGRWSTRRVATPARWTSTPTAPSRPRPCVELAEAEGLDLVRVVRLLGLLHRPPMLEAVGHPVAVNPDRVLAKVAKEREWEVHAVHQAGTAAGPGERPQPAGHGHGAAAAPPPAGRRLARWWPGASARRPQGRDPVRRRPGCGASGRDCAGPTSPRRPALPRLRAGWLRKDGAAWRRRRPAQR